MTPAAARAMLDRQLSAHGQTMTLRRFTGPTLSPLSTWSDTTVQVKEAQVSEDEIAAGIFTSGRKLILSPTQVGAGPVATKKDALLDGGTKRVVQAWWPKKIGGEVVRIEAQVG